MPDKKIIAVVGATGAQGGGLARAIAADRGGAFTVRAITRHPDSDKARALATLGCEVITADLDDSASVERAFAGAYGAFCVTNYWELLSAEHEGRQAATLAQATRKAGVQHVIWSTLEDTRKRVPLSDNRLPTLQGKYKCPHFDSKGQMDAVFAAEAGPTSYLLAAFYWENFIHFGMGPRKGADGELVLALPLGGAKLPGIGAGDIGKCAYGIFRQGATAVGKRFGIGGDILSGEQMATAMGKAIGRKVGFYDMPFDAYRALGFPGAQDLGNMFQYHQIMGDEFLRARDPKLARTLDPELQDFNAWLAQNASRIPIG
jgi:uncharacterized protein YbjT (DUF2867 family)